MITKVMLFTCVISRQNVQAESTLKSSAGFLSFLPFLLLFAEGGA